MESANTPTDAEFQCWVNAALAHTKSLFELTIRLVDNDEIQQLNLQYRHKDKPTNVLSFPFEVPDGIELNLLGDIIIAIEVVEKEAIEQNKNLKDHWAHMVIHGCLHLLGYDHINNDEAEEMETLEIEILKGLSITNPYHLEQ
jgi:probable rRNA maturation factor